MYPAINAWTFSDEPDPRAQIKLAANAGFEGIELTLGADGPLTPDVPLDTFRDLRTAADDTGIRIDGLACGLFFQTNYASPDASDRMHAYEMTLHMLDRALEAGAGSILVVPAVVGHAQDARPNVSYQDAYRRTLEALSALGREAEARAVTIAIENVWNRFLLSPIEAADLIDQINSPHVGFYLDTGNLMPYGYPRDWIATLAGRIARVHAKDYDLSRPGKDGFCALGEGSVDWPEVVGGLRDVGYDGPLTYEGAGDPNEIARRLRAILDNTPAKEMETD